jgi:hypothetical protein
MAIHRDAPRRSTGNFLIGWPRPGGTFGLVEVQLHPDIGPLAFLLGTWRGRGTGEYPTIEPFAYEEELEFAHVGKPYLTFRQRTWRPRDGEVLSSHMELGFWRPRPDGGVEVVSAHPNGVAEIETGTVEEGRIELVSQKIVTSPSAKDVTRLERRFLVDGDTLTYDVRMAAVGQALSPHLHAELRRVSSSRGSPSSGRGRGSG